MISTNQIAFFKHSADDDESRFVVSLSCHLGHVVYSDKKVKASEILSFD